MDSIASHYAAKRTRIDPAVEKDVRITDVLQSNGWTGPIVSGAVPTPPAKATKVKTEAEQADARRRMELARARRKSGVAPRRSSRAYC
jgi:hypothetical protein